MTVVKVAIAVRSAPCAYRGCDGEARTQGGRQARIVEHNLHGDSLYDFRKVAGSVVGRQQGELRTAGRCNLDDFAQKELPWVFVYANLHSIAHLHVRELGLAIIFLNPLTSAAERYYLRSRRHQLSGPDLPFAHGAITWRLDLRVAKVHLGYSE